MATDPVGRTPWYHWLIGVLGIAWNAFGAMDFAMTQLRGEAWLRQMQMTEPQIAYFNAMPAWTHVAWFLGTWGGVLGAILLLLRSRHAVPAFAVSLIAYVATLIYTYLLSGGAEAIGSTQTSIMQAVIFAGCLFFLWYARRAHARGILR